MERKCSMGWLKTIIEIVKFWDNEFERGFKSTYKEKLDYRKWK